MTCKTATALLYQELDGRLVEGSHRELKAHLEKCVACQKAAASIHLLDQALGKAEAAIQPSPEFEARFWNAVREQAREPWWSKLFKELESLIPTPTTAQACAMVFVALLIGSTGGAASAMEAKRSMQQAQTTPVALHYLSGFSEFKGLPSASIGASYLKTLEKGQAR